MVLSFEDNELHPRKIFIVVLLCQFMGIMNFNRMPAVALLYGAVGYILTLTVFQICVGIPLIYMEFIVGQFTQRDCIDVWKIRPCFSHIGYLIIFWQICILISNHIVTSFIVHYVLITFESPIPYFTCGQWSSNDCNILTTNYTMNQDCIKLQKIHVSYCEDIYKTFPEYQYWRYHLLPRKNIEGFNIAWKVCLASGLVCMVVYASCFKRWTSLKWGVSFLTIYSLLSVMVTLMGSMRQKGIVVKCVDALGLDFMDFSKKFRLSNIIQQLVYNLGIGSGLTFNLASSSSFRSPCFSNSVISIVIITVFSIFTVITMTMITCPYAYEYGLSPGSVFRTPMSLTFEKIPRLVFEYNHKTFFLVVIFSTNASLGLCTNVIVFYNLLETTLRRNKVLMNYPGLTTLCGIVMLFLISIPFLSHIGMNIIAVSFRTHVILLSSLISLLECLLFVIWYGIHRLSEDVHFMLGIQPNNWMKSAWILSCLFLGYTFFNELFYQTKHSQYFYIVLSISVTIFGTCCLKLLVALCKGRFMEMFVMDPTWGPKKDLLQRSRAMFTAQAMTKEYMYRQYHLQAGIVSRQKRSNIRVERV